MSRSRLTTCLLLPLLVGSAAAGLVPQKRTDICGVKGYDRDTTGANYDYNDSGKYGTYATCSAKCAADTKCKSFGYGDSVCMLFNIALSGNFDADSGSSYTYYDVGCLRAASSTTSTSTATSVKTTSASTQKTTSTPTSAPTSTPTSTPTKADTSSTSKTTTTTSTPTSKSSSSSSPTKASTTTPSSAGVATSSTPTGTSTPSGTSTTTSTAPSSTVSIPAGCNVAQSISMTSFTWFNSTHNLDCVSANYPSDAQVCWTDTRVCQPGESGCTCTPYCYTGLPAVAYQPLGFGPPDTINVGFNGAGTTCAAANPQSIRRNELGGGHFDCGSAADYIGFTGDSNQDAGGVGSIYYNAYGSACGSSVPRYTASFPLLCSRDAGNNATCTASLPVTLTLASL